MFKILFLIIGGMCLIGTGAWFAWDAFSFVDEAERSDGVVVRVVAKAAARGGPFYHPVVRFRANEASEPFEFTARPGLWPSLHHAGDKVTVAYLPEAPTGARVVSFWMLWFLPLVSAVLGGLCVFAGWHTHNTAKQ